MARQVVWDDLKRFEFLDLSGISRRVAEYNRDIDNLAKDVFLMHTDDFTDEEIADELDLEVKAVKRMVREFKDIYDEVQPHSKYLKPRANLTQYDLRKATG